MRGTLATFAPVVALLVAGCGNSVTPPENATPSPTPTASPVLSLLVVADPSPYPGQLTSVRFFKLDGSEVSHVMLDTGDQVVAASGARVFVLSTKGKLRGLHRDGTSEDLADFGNAGVVFVASPDGRRWLWSTSSSDGNTINSAIHLGGVGVTPRVIQSASTSMASGARALRPYEWTSVGAFVEHGAVGIGGYIPYVAATGPVDQLDVDTGAATAISSSTTCSFSDISADGTIACFPLRTQHTLRMVHRDGSVVDIPLSTPRFNLTGDAYFSGNGQLLTVAGAVGVGFSAQERYGTDLVKPGDASISRISLEGVRPAGFMRAACWLADGSFVVYRPDNTADAPGVFIVAPSGASTQISKSGVPVGVLTS